MSQSKLNKDLYVEINKLKNLNVHTQPKFILDESPFKEDDDDDQPTAAVRKDIVIIGRVLPDSDVYNQGAYSIEIKLTPTYPFDPPEVRFLTKIYHPNVAEDGKNDAGI
jgi:ubiquitin-protein ligase